jgi:predicted ATPase/class 3 adenylate cyclase
MMNIPGYEIQNQCWQDEGTVTHRGVHLETYARVLIKLPRSGLGEMSRLDQEYEIACSLDSNAVVRPLRKERYQQSSALIFEDDGSKPLAEVIAREPMTLDANLEIAIGIARALGTVHQQRVLHRNLTLDSIWINPRSHAVRLTGFYLARRMAYDGQLLYTEGRLEGPISYMSPEQTGRTSRGLDFRSDYYSLGVLLYRLLTGRLPFDASDPMDLVHCHLAKRPQAPASLDPDIPTVVSDLVMILLSKNPEERYQSLGGLRADLEECLAQWRTHRTLAAIVLRKRDISEFFRVSKKLYGRETDVAELLSAYERCARGAGELVLVSGDPGIGKSVLVNEVQKPITQSRGVFISGKFDQYKRNVPYASIIQAFQQLVRQILGGTDAEVALWKERLTTALSANAAVITEVIPEIELLMGPQEPVPDLPPAEARNRFNRLFRDFINVFAKNDRPLVVFLDDLQWADLASLSLLLLLLKDQDTPHVLVIGAYRDTEVSASHPLAMTMDELRTSGVSLIDIKLGPLHLPDVRRLVCDTVRCSEGEASPLADLLDLRTGGNPFFVIQLLQFAHSQGIIRFDPEVDRWRWDLEQFRHLGCDASITDLMNSRLRKLQPATRNALAMAACLGSAFDLDTMALVLEQSQKTAGELLREPLREGLIYTPADVYQLFEGSSESCMSEEGPTVVRFFFLHDRVQQASFALIAAHEQKAVRFKIGRILRQATSDERLEESPFDVVNNLNFGADLIQTQAERHDLAQLNLIAGRKARESMAYDDAVAFLRMSLNLLTPESWQHMYQLSLQVHEECFECEYLTGNFDQASSLFDVLVKNAQTRLEKARVYYTKVLLNTSLGHGEEAVRVGVEGLKLFRISLPLRPRAGHLLFELGKVKLSMRGRTPDELLGLPEMADPEQVAAIRLLMIICPAAYFNNPELMMLAALKIVNLSLRYGNASVSSFGYILYALMLGAALGNYEKGHAFGRLAVSLSMRYDDVVLRCKVLMIFAGFVNFWRQPIDTSRELLPESFKLSLDAGDVQYANYSVNQTLFLGLSRGLRLDEVIATGNRYAEFSAATKDPFAIESQGFWIQTALALGGRTRSGVSLSSEGYDEDRRVAAVQAGGNLTLLTYYYTLKEQLAYTFGDFALAQRLALQAEGLMEKAISQIVEVDHCLYYGLTATALLRQQPGRRLVLWKTLLRSLRKMAVWADNCPSNFRHHLLLLKAEIAALTRRPERAMRLYEDAIVSARNHGYVQLEALGNELAATFYLSRGHRKVAETYLLEARKGYKAWGAVAKVRQMEDQYADLLEIPAGQAGVPPSAFMAGYANIGSVDKQAVLRAAQAIALESRPDQLLENLVRTAIQHAGAERAVFVFEEDGVLRVEAEAAVEGEKIAVLQSVPIDQSGAVCPAIVHYVARTKLSLVLHDATGDPHFEMDPYVLTSRPLSILCAPVMLQNAVVGVLYLENNLTTGAFTTERIEILQVIASAVAFAIENARLQSHMRNQDHALETALRNVELLELAKRHLGKFVPQHVRRAVDEAPDSLELGKRERDVAVLFLDIAGYTRISEQLERSQVDELVERYFSGFLDEIHKNGGDVNETAGDGLMVTFQDASELEHAAQAARTALFVQDLTRRLNALLQGSFEPILVHIGINCGVASVGITRFEGVRGERYTYTTSGSVTNLTARLASAAKGGTILVSAEMAARLAGAFVLEPQGLRRFKNVAEPVEVFRLVSELHTSAAANQ